MMLAYAIMCYAGFSTGVVALRNQILWNKANHFFRLSAGFFAELCGRACWLPQITQWNGWNSCIGYWCTRCTIVLWLHTFAYALMIFGIGDQWRHLSKCHYFPLVITIIIYCIMVCKLCPYTHPPILIWQNQQYNAWPHLGHMFIICWFTAGTGHQKMMVGWSEKNKIEKTFFEVTNVSL
jgi:hypothetical protein